MITNLILIIIALLLATQTAAILANRPRPVAGVLPHPLIWELQRLDLQIKTF